MTNFYSGMLNFSFGVSGMHRKYLSDDQVLI